MTDDRLVLADFIGRRNWPTLSFVWHPLNTENTWSKCHVKISEQITGL